MYRFHGWLILARVVSMSYSPFHVPLQAAAINYFLS
jgi:hypothetical protein